MHKMRLDLERKVTTWRRPNGSETSSPKVLGLLAPPLDPARTVIPQPRGGRLDHGDSGVGTLPFGEYHGQDQGYLKQVLAQASRSRPPLPSSRIKSAPGTASSREQGADFSLTLMQKLYSEAGLGRMTVNWSREGSSHFNQSTLVHLTRDGCRGREEGYRGGGLAA